LNATQVDREVLDETIGCFLKDEADIAVFKAEPRVYADERE